MDRTGALSRWRVVRRQLCTTRGDDRIKLFEESAEIGIWIRLDPVEFFWLSIVTVQAQPNTVCAP
jgi:hypothetical protein